MPDTKTPDAPPRSRFHSVQSVERAFELLEALADARRAVGLSDLAESSGLPLPTIHRLIRTLVNLGYVRQEKSRDYVLSGRLIWLGELAGRLISTSAVPHLCRLADSLGETANFAMLDGNQIVYLAQVPSRHGAPTDTEVGSHVPPHCTAVGKALLADMLDDDVRALLSRTGMARHTEKTITDPQTFIDQLARIRSAGYAIDNAELRNGIRCVAAKIPGAPSAFAFSVSGPATRMTHRLLHRAAVLLPSTARKFAAEVSSSPPRTIPRYLTTGA